MMTFSTVGPSAVDTTIASTSSGRPWRMSSTRCASRSVLPPM